MKRKKYFTYFIVVILVIVVINILDYAFEDSNDNSTSVETTNEIAKTTETINTDLDEIENEAAKNSLTFNEKYKNKRVVFSAKIASGDISRFSFGEKNWLYVKIEAIGFGSHPCYFDESEESSLKNITGGSTVRISAIPTQDGNLSFFNCKIE